MTDTIFTISCNSHKRCAQDDVRSSKRAKKESQGISSSVCNASTPAVLVEDAIGIVMEFLAPRELLRLSMTCKALRAKLTTPLVVRSAMMHGGHAAKTVDVLRTMVRNMSIHPPSPERLLRLVNGKKCEICLQRRMNHARRGYGLFVCTPCLMGFYEQDSPKGRCISFRRYPCYVDMVDSPGQHGWHSRSDLFFTWPRAKTTSTGEPCGPLLTSCDVARILPHDRRIARGTEKDLESIIGWQFPTIDKYQEFLNAYDETHESATAAEAERRAKRQETKMRAELSRKENAMEVVAKIQAELSDRYRDWALSYKETGLKGCKPCFVFDSPFCDEILRKYMAAPSKAKKGVVTRIAYLLNKNFALLEQHFLGRPLLHDRNILDPQLRRYVLELKDYMQRHFSSFKSYIHHPRTDSKFFALITENRMLEAATYLVYSENLPVDVARATKNSAAVLQVGEHQGVPHRVLHHSAYNLHDILRFDRVKRNQLHGAILSETKWFHDSAIHRRRPTTASNYPT